MGMERKNRQTQGVNMIPRSMTKFDKMKITSVTIAWIVLSMVLYFGIAEINLHGHIEMSLIISFAVILLSIHLFSVLKTAVRHYV